MPSRNEEQWTAMLQRLADRDGAVELSRRCNDDHCAAIVYRSRVFEVMADGCIVVEVPRQAVRDASFGIGGDIDLTLMLNSDRMVASCTLNEMITYKVNPTLSVTCYRLSPGRRPTREQRRSFYRVAVAAMQLRPVKLASTIDDAAFECIGKLSNISAGGLGVSIRAVDAVLNKIKRTRRFNCTAWIGEDGRIVAPVRIAHIEALQDDGLYLGLQFDLEDDTEKRALEQRMQQRCTEIQRMQLQRRRA